MLEQPKDFFVIFNEKHEDYKAGRITDPDELECWESFLKEFPEFGGK